MNDDWVMVPLSEVAVENRNRVTLEPGIAYPTVGVLRDGRGLLEREPFVGGETTYKRLTPLRAGQLVLRSITAWEAPIAVAGAEHEGRHVSGVFPVFDLDTSRLLPGFMGLICQHPRFWKEMRQRTTGSVLRRRTLSARSLLEIPINLPPCDEQRRIVDLIAAVDGMEEAARGFAGRCDDALAAFLNDADARFREGGVRSLGELMAMASGASWSAEQERSLPQVGSVPVLKITNTKADGSLDMKQRMYVAGLVRPRLLDASSLILIRTNGSRGRIGNVYRATPEVIGHAVSAFQIAGFPADPADAAFIYWMLRVPSTQAAISSAASGTTGLSNIAIGWLRALYVPWPPLPERVACSELAEALTTARGCAWRYAERAQQARAALLDALLSGRQRICASYDALIDAS